MGAPTTNCLFGFLLETKRKPQKRNFDPTDDGKNIESLATLSNKKFVNRSLLDVLASLLFTRF